MPSLSVEYATEAERAALEQAIAFFTQMREVAAGAPDGTVLDACERLALGDGRAAIRGVLAAAVQARADAVDAQKKSPAPRPRGGGRGG